MAKRREGVDPAFWPLSGGTPMRTWRLTGYVFTCGLLISSTAVSQNLLENGSFESGTDGWVDVGDVSIISDAWEGSSAARLDPQPELTAELSQTVTGLQPTMRYTIAARIRSENHIVPPIVGIRGGAQIDKALGWVAIDEENRWLERRFEFYLDEDSTSIEVFLQGWKTEEEGAVEFDSVGLFQGRIDPPSSDEGQPDWPGAPEIQTAPNKGDSLLGNPEFDDSSGGAWALGIHASIVELEGVQTAQLISSEDTSRVTQPLSAALPPGQTWILSAEAKVDPDVVATLYFTTPDGFIATHSFSNTNWERIEVPIVSGEAWLNSGKVYLENYKNQPGGAWFRNIELTAQGNEWVATLNSPPAVRGEVFFDDFSNGIDSDQWLISEKGWGGDNAGVRASNVKLVEDLDEGSPITALRLEAHGDDYTGGPQREGAAIATRGYYASGLYEVRAKIAPEYGVCTAFWPFHYIDHRMGEAEYWHEPNPRRNTEIDWEFPTDLAGSDTGNFSFTKARTNSWGGQFGGEGGEHKGRKILTDESGQPLDLAQEALDGRYHTFAIEWQSGEDLGDEAITRSDVGSVRWYLDGRLVDELNDVEFGQGNVPYRAARFWLGTWFPAAGYAGNVGWTGDPNFNTAAAHIAWVRITPYLQPRDTWTDETVPNLAWATPEDYPETNSNSSPADLNNDGRVNGADLGLLLAVWNSENASADIDESGTVDGADLGIILLEWTG